MDFSISLHSVEMIVFIVENQCHRSLSKNSGKSTGYVIGRFGTSYRSCGRRYEIS